MNRFIQKANAELTTIYPPQEAAAITRQLLQSVCQMSNAQILMHKNTELSPDIRTTLEEKLTALLSGRPLQYVLGEALFYGLEFRVDPSVLIPRPETEELVELILTENRDENLAVLDIGTGSGCIAITLSKQLINPIVYACDISVDALTTAKNNALHNKAVVQFIQNNILDYSSELGISCLDIIVSNPPYVCQSEAKDMHTNVLQFEPHLALFVSDQDPLLFYRTIAERGLKLLRPGGKIYFEINAAFGPETASLLQQLGYQDTAVISDIFGKHRIVKAIRP
jgi:release factor glutamine methyltransferase